MRSSAYPRSSAWRSTSGTPKKSARDRTCSSPIQNRRCSRQACSTFVLRRRASSIPSCASGRPLVSYRPTVIGHPHHAPDRRLRASDNAHIGAVLVSLLYGCMYIIRFGTMRKLHKASSFAN
ncbi:hypothetical protein B0H17DRAFT_1039028 [Mycena rosella]|uniref:Uncharacterized protein n=1 Tax=Mycena rosella TaxID=1033263 RepID=A0AAD7M7V5_MYCRO|nr:hypothetical protein B0H17DRAFT_1039028 [Mycena rosella]